MELANAFETINYWAVLIAAISAYLIGFVWYSFLFTKPWMRSNQLTKESLREGNVSPSTALALMFLNALLAAIILAVFLGPGSTVGFGVIAGLLVSIFWISTARFNAVLFEKQKLNLFLINAGYDILSYMVMGAIIGAWH